MLCGYFRYSLDSSNPTPATRITFSAPSNISLMVNIRFAEHFLTKNWGRQKHGHPAGNHLVPQGPRSTQQATKVLVNYSGTLANQPFNCASKQILHIDCNAVEVRSIHQVMSNTSFSAMDVL